MGFNKKTVPPHGRSHAGVTGWVFSLLFFFLLVLV